MEQFPSGRFNVNATMHTALMKLLAQRHRYLGKVLGLSSMFVCNDPDNYLDC